MKLHIIIYILLLVKLLVSCENDADCRVDTQTLKDFEKDFINYNEGDSVIFVDGNGKFYYLKCISIVDTIEKFYVTDMTCPSGNAILSIHTYNAILKTNIPFKEKENYEVIYGVGKLFFDSEESFNGRQRLFFKLKPNDQFIYNEGSYSEYFHFKHKNKLFLGNNTYDSVTIITYTKSYDYYSIPFDEAWFDSIYLNKSFGIIKLVAINNEIINTYTLIK